MILGFPRAKQGLCHYDIMGGGTHLESASPLRPLNRISWNFQELFTTCCHTAPPILSFYSNDFGVSQSKTRTLPLQHVEGPISNPLHITKHGLCPGTCRMTGYQPLIYFSLIYSQNFIILIGFICYMMTYPTSYFTFWFDWFLDFPP